MNEWSNVGFLAWGRRGTIFIITEFQFTIARGTRCINTEFQFTIAS